MTSPTGFYLSPGEAAAYSPGKGDPTLGVKWGSPLKLQNSATSTAYTKNYVSLGHGEILPVGLKWADFANKRFVFEINPRVVDVSVVDDDGVLQHLTLPFGWLIFSFSLKKVDQDGMGDLYSLNDLNIFGEDMPCVSLDASVFHLSHPLIESVLHHSMRMTTFRSVKDAFEMVSNIAWRFPIRHDSYPFNADLLSTEEREVLQEHDGDQLKYMEYFCGVEPIQLLMLTRSEDVMCNLYKHMHSMYGEDDTTALEYLASLI